MKLGIISDSHDHIQNVQKAVKIFKEAKTEFVIHLGDFVAPPVVKLFSGLNLIGIFGNNDGEKMNLLMMFSAVKGNLKGEFFSDKFDGLNVAAYPGTVAEITDALIECEKYDLVLSGHNHQKRFKKIGKTLSLNPGTAHGFNGPATIAIFDTKTKNAEFIEL